MVSAASAPTPCQLGALAADARRREPVELRVLPPAIGAHDALVGPFPVLGFATAQSIAYVELVNGAVYVQEQEQVRGYDRTVRRLPHDDLIDGGRHVHP